MLTPQQLFARLDELGLAHRTVEHAPVYTVEEAKSHRGVLPGHHIKNLFLRNKKEQMWLGGGAEVRPHGPKPAGGRVGARAGVRSAAPNVSPGISASSRAR